VQGTTLRLAARRLGLGVPSRVEPPKSVELDLPGQLALELIGFHVVEGSPILTGARLPDWARLVLIVRDGHVLESDEVGSLRGGDFCYFLAPPRRAHDLDALFVAREPSS
jgi:cell volume regulation protein A